MTTATKSKPAETESFRTSPINTDECATDRTSSLTSEARQILMHVLRLVPDVKPERFQCAVEYLCSDAGASFIQTICSEDWKQDQQGFRKRFHKELTADQFRSKRPYLDSLLLLQLSYQTWQGAVWDMDPNYALMMSADTNMESFGR